MPVVDRYSRFKMEEEEEEDKEGRPRKQKQYKTLNQGRVKPSVAGWLAGYRRMVPSQAFYFRSHGREERTHLLPDHL